MARLKELMKGYKTRTFGKYKVVKELAHSFDEKLNERYCFIYMIYNLETGKEMK